MTQFDIGSQVVGRKDMSKNVLDIWKEVICYSLMELSLPWLLRVSEY